MQNIPTMLTPNDNHEAITFRHHDHNMREVYVTDKEFVLDSKVIFSTSDLQGNITKVNEQFITASGWTEEELIGAPHYILRHPDMPKTAFKDMWKKLNTTGNWHGYVKNLRKDGGYYWVHAMVHATKSNGEIVGFQSARHKITDSQKEKYEKMYAEMRAQEATAN